MKKRKLILRPDGCYDVPLTRGLFAVVDAEDAELVGRYNWSATPRSYGGYYASTNIRNGAGERQTLYLHGVLLYGLEPSGKLRHVDHRDHDSLNNRRDNIRPAGHSTNGANRHGWSSSGYKGVYAQPSGFIAQIRKQKQLHHLGMFQDPAEAAKAYDAAARVFHGEFAKLNFPEGSA